MKSDNWDYSQRSYNGKIFFDELIKEFPVIMKEIQNEDTPMIHSKMEIFANYTIQMIKNGDDLETNKCYGFIEDRIDLMNLELINAVTVSYCESLMLGSIADQIRLLIKSMPVKLKDHYLDYKKHYDNLINSKNTI